MHRNCAKSLFVRASPNRVHITGDVEQDMRLQADIPWRSLPFRPTTRGLDLLNIAAGVYAADRVVKRTPGAGNEMGIRTLRLHFAVDDLAFWQRLEVTEATEQLLSFLTDENWALSFHQAATAVTGSIQQSLDLPMTRKPRRVALYSGGLDSAAGLANRVLEGVDDYLLVTVGHQSGLRRRCVEQINELSNKTRTPRQMHSTLIAGLQGGAAAKRSRQQEGSQRSRAFLFCAAAVVAAQTCQIDEIEIFENGVGAINLPVMPGMLVGGLATRGAHPTFLRMMGQLASVVAENPVRFSLPFATLTKAEMLAPLNERGLEAWAQLSRSCIHTSWRDPQASHCGQCPGCIERRQAFAAAGICEPVSDSYSVDLAARASLKQANVDYLRCYLSDAAAWLADDAAVRRRLSWHLDGTQVPSEQHAAVLERQYRHAKEVISTLGHLAI